MRKSSLAPWLTAGAVALTLALVAAPTYGAPGGGGGGGGGGGAGGAGGAGNSGGSAGSGGSGGAHPCKNGEVYSQQQKKCVQASLLDDKQIFTQARLLALAGHYDDALHTLAQVRNQQHDMVLTYIGYSKRKLGMVDEGIAYYHQALSINPKNLDTREYLGEGYVAAGRTDLAVAELNKLEALCGRDCDQYEQLELAIAGTPEHWQ